MDEDLRCCGTGTCLINAEGICWCGQRWDGTKMCFSDSPHSSGAASPPPELYTPERVQKDAAEADTRVQTQAKRNMAAKAELKPG